MSNDVYHSGYLALVVCDFFLFPSKRTGIAGHRGDSNWITEGDGQHHRKWDFRRYFRAGPGPGVCLLKGTYLKETIQTCGYGTH